MLVATASCATTTYDARYDTSVPVPKEPTAPSTTLGGPAAELLAELLAEAASLSSTITTRGGKGSVAERVRALWEASRSEVERERPDLVSSFEINVVRCETAARLNRAADADKAYLNLRALTTSFSAAPAASSG